MIHDRFHEYKVDNMTWLEEIALDNHGPPVQMGVRKLKSRSWLLRDEKEQEELDLKRTLRSDPTKEVFLSRKGTEEASENVVSLINSKDRLVVEGEMHPLDRAGLSVQEDLCLMNRTSEGWILKAASLCFPSRWQLREKIGKDISQIHGPVEGYEEHLSKKVNGFFDRLGKELYGEGIGSFTRKTVCINRNNHQTAPDNRF